MRHIYFRHDKDKPCVHTITPINTHTCNDMQEVLHSVSRKCSAHKYIANFPNSHLIFYNKIYIPNIPKIMLAYFVNAYPSFSSPLPPQPLLSPQELEITKAVVKEFGREGGTGEKLHQALLEKTKNNDSWVGARE